MPPRSPDLPALLDALDPDAPLASRHTWLVHLMEWIRGEADDPAGPVARVRLLLDAVEARPAWQALWRRWWATFLRTVDFTPLWADLGFAPRVSFFSEFMSRLRRRWLPGTPETDDIDALFPLLLRDPRDARWLRALDGATLARARALLFDAAAEEAAPPAEAAGRAGPWTDTLVDAVMLACSQVCATGFSPEIRCRMSAETHRSRPFHDLADVLQEWRATVLAEGRASDAARAQGQRLRGQLETCRQAAYTVFQHFEAYGVSVGIVFRLRQFGARVRRIRLLLDTLESAAPERAGTRLVATLVQEYHHGVSLRQLVASNAQLVAAKVAERSAETGEQYITRNGAEYGRMLGKAAGGGAVLAFTTWLKFALGALALPTFWAGLAAGLNYAASFVLVQFLHFTVATKQPAVTAPAMVAKLHDISRPRALRAFVDEVAHLLRSQIAAILGNVGAVVPVVLAISMALAALRGEGMIDAQSADYVLRSLQFNPLTLFYAAFTGTLLFASSIIAGWCENAFVLYRLDSALAHNPRITRRLGPARAARWAAFLRANMSGLAANISLGLMLGLVPAFGAFFGLGLEVRHVTLAAGQLTAAASALGGDALSRPDFWWAVLGVLAIGPLNLGVSFYCAFRLALRAQGVSHVNRDRIGKAIRSRLRRSGWTFFWPPRA